MKTKLLPLFVALFATSALWASNTITYTATSKLTETTDKYSAGLHTNAFNTAISSHTFSNGTGTITFSGEITTIRDFAFDRCSGLTSITIPSSVTTIGKQAFYYVNNIVYSGTATGSPWGAKCMNGYVDGYWVYSDATKTTLCGCSAAKGEITIPNSVTTIGYGAFQDCSGLTSVTIPNSVTTIGNRAFQYCSGLTSVTIPNSVTTIGNMSFQYCRGLTSITIPNSVTTIGIQAFASCSGLTSVTCYAIVPPSCGDDCFYGVNHTFPLYVPTESIKAYKIADEWKDYRVVTDKPAVPRLLDTEILYADTLQHALEAKGFWLTPNCSKYSIYMAGIWSGCYCYALIMKYDSVHAIGASINVTGQKLDSIYRYFYDDIKAQFPNAIYRQLSNGDTIFDYWIDSPYDRAHAMVELYRIQMKTGKLGFRKKTTAVMCEVWNEDAYQTLSGKTLSVPDNTSLRLKKVRRFIHWLSAVFLVICLSVSIAQKKEEGPQNAE